MGDVNIVPGLRVVISDDCRDNPTANGKHGIIESYDPIELEMDDGMIQECLSSPKIRLDDGDVIMGCECWWEPEE